MSHVVTPPGVSFASVNGPLMLEHLLGQRPDLQPYTLTANGLFDGGVAGELELEINVPGDSDFHAIAASLAVIDPGTPTVEGFTGQPQLSPAYWWAHADITEDHGGKKLSNIPVSVGSIFGRGDRPFVYPVPWEIKAGTRIEVEIYTQSLLGSTNSRAIVCFHGVKRRKGSKPLPMPLLSEPRLLDILGRYVAAGRLGHVDPYFYSLFTGHDANGSQVGFAPMATESPTFTVSGHDFAACYLMAEFYDDVGAAFLDEAAAGLPDLTVQLVLDEGAVQLSSRPLHVNTIFGHGKRWTKLPVPLLIENGHSLTAIVTPLKNSGGTTNNWLGHLTFAGARLYGRR
mgnify:CR=1 FL=1